MIQPKRIWKSLRQAVPALKGDAMVGLVWSAGQVEWSVLHRRTQTFDSSAPRRAAVPVDAPGAAPALPPEAAVTPAPLALALPAEYAMLRVVDLPATDRAELQGMAELQADRYAPFSTEELLVSYEVLQQNDGTSRTLIAAIPREKVEPYAEACRAEGLDPEHVDIDLVAWWQAVAQAGGAKLPGRVIHVRADGGSPALIMAQEGIPLVFRSLPHPVPQAAIDWTDLPAEIDYTLTSAESEWGGHGAVDLLLRVEGAGPGEEVLARLRAIPGVARVTLADGPALPPLSHVVARRATGTAPHLNLAPASWSAVRESRAGVARFFLVMGGIIGLWLLAALVLFGLEHFEKGRLRVEKGRMDALAGPADEVQQLQSKMKSLETYADRRRSALEVLRQVTVAMPEGVTLTGFTYRKGKSAALRGESDRVDTIYDFIKTLQESGLFSEIKPEGISSRSSRGGPTRQEFRISASLPEEAP